MSLVRLRYYGKHLPATIIMMVLLSCVLTQCVLASLSISQIVSPGASLSAYSQHDSHQQVSSSQHNDHANHQTNHQTTVQDDPDNCCSSSDCCDDMQSINSVSYQDLTYISQQVSFVGRLFTAFERYLGVTRFTASPYKIPIRVQHCCFLI